MKYVDSHCHIERYPDPLGVLRAAAEAQVVTVAVTELPSAFQRLSLRLGKRPGVRVALGLHPMRAGQATPMELALFVRQLGRTDYVGEVGLDGSQHGHASLRAQRRVFEHILSQPRMRDKVLTVHSRGAEEETIRGLVEAGSNGILHWYSGPVKHIDTALAAGLWFSVNPAMLRSKHGQRIIAALPPDRVVTETDGPYAKLGQRPSEPRDIPAVVLGLARAWNIEPEEARQQVFETMGSIARTARNASVTDSRKDQPTD